MRRASRVGRDLAASLMVAACTVSAFDLTFDTYARFLEDYVCPEGVVYSRIGGDPRIEAIAAEFASLPESEFKALPSSDQIAYLVNAYNFHTIALIVRHYPLSTGIRDIEKPWDQKFISLFGAKVSLNHIEHDLLRKNYPDPRVHFALNCASIGCPPLRRAPYRGAELDQQLSRATRAFVADTSRNRVEGDKLMLSQIIDWYGGDFQKPYGRAARFVQDLLSLTGKYKVKYLDYDWSLNEAPPCTKQRE